LLLAAGTMAEANTSAPLEVGVELPSSAVSVSRSAVGSVADLSEATFFPVQRGFPAPFAADFYDRLAASLPAYDRSVGTVGIMVTDEGAIYRFTSQSAPYVLRNYAAAGHVEGQAAFTLDATGSQGGIIFHNNPGGTCGWCVSQTPTLLPNGISLDIVPPANARALPGWYDYPMTRTGLPEAPSLHPQDRPGFLLELQR
jgi:hypothetical protein